MLLLTFIDVQNEPNVKFEYKQEIKPKLNFIYFHIFGDLEKLGKKLYVVLRLKGPD